MANFQYQCTELLKFLPDLQCQKCKDVPGPSNPKKRRYSCMDGSHVLCEEHKAKCPCGALVAKKPSPTIEKLLQDMPFMCKNYEHGCRDIKIDAKELERHQERCTFRQVFCPYWGCNDKKITFKDFDDHSAFHKNYYGVRKIVSGSYKISYHCTNLYSRKNTIGKVLCNDGYVLYDGAYIVNSAFHFVMYIFGSKEEARNDLARRKRMAQAMYDI